MLAGKKKDVSKMKQQEKKVGSKKQEEEKQQWDQDHFGNLKV